MQIFFCKTGMIIRYSQEVASWRTTEFLRELISYEDLFLWNRNDPWRLVVAELYLLYTCMLVEYLFIKTKPIWLRVINVIINVQAVLGNVSHNQINPDLKGLPYLFGYKPSDFYSNSC